MTLVQATPSAQGQGLGSDSAGSHQQQTFLASGRIATSILEGGSGQDQAPAACTLPTELRESVHSSKTLNDWNQTLACRQGSLSSSLFLMHLFHSGLLSVPYCTWPKIVSSRPQFKHYSFILREQATQNGPAGVGVHSLTYQ